jgi:NADH dehydrogenase
MPAHETQKRLLIIGGGYAGVKLALKLGKQRIPKLRITLVTGKAYFEYYPTIYRVAVGYSALQVCIGLSEIFAGTRVEIIEDRITRVDLEHKTVMGGIDSPYTYDYLVLAVGAETSFFNIPGLQENSYGIKSTTQALLLKEHIRAMLQPADPTAAPEQKVIAGHFVVVGAGPTGTELSSELMEYGRAVAKQQGSDPSLVTVDLIEAAPRVMPTMPVDVSARVEQRLRTLGVNVLINRAVIKQEGDDLILKDGVIKTKTVIWTAGVKTNSLIGEIAGLELDRRGRVVVDDYLQAKGHHDVFVAGDAASTEFGGTAQTADSDGKYLAKVIGEKVAGVRQHAKYVPHKPIYAIPVGPGWAVVLWGNLRIYGLLAFTLRRLADLRYFMSILPLSRAITVALKHDAVATDFDPAESAA